MGSSLDRVETEPARHPAALRKRRPEDIRAIRGAALDQQGGGECERADRAHEHVAANFLTECYRRHCGSILLAI